MSNKALRELKRELEQPRPKGYEPFTRSAYCTFSWFAERLRRQFQAQADEAARLRDLALEKYHASEPERAKAQ